MELYIKDDVDLKELEKVYGFEYFDNYGQYRFIERGLFGSNYIFVNAWNRKILYRQENENNTICLTKLYKLIKANLIEEENKKGRKNNIKKINKKKR